MNFAFVTILLLLLTLPGIAIRRSYYTSSFSLNYISTNLFNELIWSIIPAIFLHFSAILIIESFSEYRFVLENFGYLVAGGNEKEELHLIFNNLHSNLFSILLYFTGLTIIGIIIGNLMRRVIRIFGLDIKIRLFRYPNRWHYIFTGEYIDFGRGFNYHKKIDFIVVDVLMDVGGKSVIYSGILEDYYLSNTSAGLEGIVIKYPSKKEFNCDQETKIKIKDIPGDYLDIPYGKILNLNIQYFELDEDDQPLKNGDFQHNLKK